MPKRKRRPQAKPLIDETLLQLQKVPTEILHAEKVAEALTGKKLKPSKKTSVKIKSAISNYKKAVTRYKRSETLLRKHYKNLLKIYKSYFENDQQTINN